MTPADQRALKLLDQAIDDLAAGRPVVTDAEVAPLALAAARLRDAVPSPPVGAAERGRAALLAAVTAPPVVSVAPAPPAEPERRSIWGRPPVLRAAVLAAALLLATVPAFASQRALPGTALWPLRSAGQQVRTAFAGDVVARARIHFDTAARLLDAARAASGERAARLAATGRAEAAAGLAELGKRPGAGPEAERVRGRWLLAAFDELARPPVTGAGTRRSGGGGTVARRGPAAARPAEPGRSVRPRRPGWAGRGWERRRDGRPGVADRRRRGAWEDGRGWRRDGRRDGRDRPGCGRRERCDRQGRPDGPDWSDRRRDQDARRSRADRDRRLRQSPRREREQRQRGWSRPRDRRG